MKRSLVLARRARLRVRDGWRATRPASARVRARARRAGPGSGSVHVLVGPPGAGNIGDQAMVEAFLERAPGDVLVIERHPGDLRVPPPGDPARTVTSLALPHLVYGGGRARRADLARFHAVLDGAASVSVIGADMLDGGYTSVGSVRRLLVAEIAALRGVPTQLLGFSWNASPTPAALRGLRAAARAGAVPLLRDPESAERAERDGVTGVVRTADLVFAARSVEEGLPERARRWTGTERYAVVNASSLVARSTGQVEAYRQVVEHLLGTGRGVVLLPHVLRGSSDDVAACRAVAEAVADPRVHLVEEALAPAAVRGLAGGADVVVTGRMHLAIMALHRGVPPVTFSTQGKVSGLMAAVGAPELCVVPGEGMGRRVVDLLVSLEDGAVAGRVARSLPELGRLAELNLALLRDLVPEGAGREPSAATAAAASTAAAGGGGDV